MKKLFCFIWLTVLIASPLRAWGASGDDLKLYDKQGHRSEEWNQLIKPGFQAFDAGNMPTAFVFLQKAYAKGCRDGLVLYKLGTIKESTQNYKEAAELMEEARPKLKKDYPGLDLTKTIDGHLGQLYYQLDDYRKALPLLSEAIKTSPTDFTLLFITGQVMRQEDKLADAYATYQKAIALPVPPDVTPDPKLALFKELMVVAFDLKRYDESLGWAEKILDGDSNNELALSYKNQIKQMKIKGQQEQQLLETIKKY